MRHYITIALLFFTFSSNAQTKYNQDLISKSTEKIVKKIEKINELMGSAVYYEGIRPRQYDNFEKLREIASRDELIELTNHSNGVVRCYAFWALTYDHAVNLFPIVLAHLKDYELVNTQFGCIGGQEMVGDFFIGAAKSEEVDLKSINDSIQFVKLDSILIYSDSKLDAKSMAIYRSEPNEFLYSKIKELVIHDHDQTALVTLAKYKKQEDISLILGNGEKNELEDDSYFYTYKAIQEFPHQDFIPLLERHLFQTLDDSLVDGNWSEMYTAIAEYKNEKAVELLKVPFTKVKHENMRTYHIDYVYNAIQLNKCAIYDSLLWQMWMEEYRISPGVYNYLIKRDSLKAFDLAQKSMLQLDTLNVMTTDSTENLTLIMLDQILNQDKIKGIEIIRKNIKSADAHLFPIFADKVIELNNSIFIEPLFERFEKESNPYVYSKIAQALIAYHDENINSRILETRKINEKLHTGWGGESLDKILKENKLIE